MVKKDWSKRSSTRRVKQPDPGILVKWIKAGGMWPESSRAQFLKRNYIYVIQTDKAGKLIKVGKHTTAVGASILVKTGRTEWMPNVGQMIMVKIK